MQRNEKKAPEESRVKKEKGEETVTRLHKYSYSHQKKKKRAGAANRAAQCNLGTKAFNWIDKLIELGLPWLTVLQMLVFSISSQQRMGMCAEQLFESLNLRLAAAELRSQVRILSDLFSNRLALDMLKSP
jgi:hypothetical protein